MTHALKSAGAAPDFSVRREWPMVRLWRLAKIRTEKNRPDFPLLSIFLGRGVITYGEGGGQVHKPGQDLSIYQVVRKGDFVLNNQQAWRGSVGVSKHHGIISPAYIVLALTDALNSRFADYLFQSRVMINQWVISSKGVGDIQRDVHIPWLKNSKVPLPPRIEQAAIVRFLDHANRRIERYIRAKKKLIALMNEQKQAIIHRAVTRGLDPNVRLKPSGIPWLGEIPEHWEIWRISRFAKVGNGSTPSRSNIGYWSGGTYPWLNSSHVNRGFIDSTDQFVTEAALRECHLPRVPVGSVLVAITGQGKTRGTSAVLGMEATINQHMAFITPTSTTVVPEFLKLALTGAYTTLRALSEDSGSTKGALTCEDLKRFKLAVPPREEQKGLVAEIRVATRDIDAAITRTEREIALIREYRTRLVADVVTGQLDVREAAAKLPDEPREGDIEPVEDSAEDEVEASEFEEVAGSGTIG